MLDPVWDIRVSTLIVVVHLLFILKSLVACSTRILSWDVAKEILRLAFGLNSGLRTRRTSHTNLDVVDLLLLVATHRLELVCSHWALVPLWWALSLLIVNKHDLIFLNFGKLITLILLELLLVRIFVFSL